MSTAKTLILVPLLILASLDLSFAADELPTTSLTIQAEIPRAGDFMGCNNAPTNLHSSGRGTRQASKRCSAEGRLHGERKPTDGIR